MYNEPMEWTNGIHGVIQYLLPQTNEDQNENQLSTVLWKWGGMTQNQNQYHTWFY